MLPTPADDEEKVKLQDYLREQLRRRQQDQEDLMAQSATQRDANLGALLAKSAAQFGTLRGRTADASPTEDFAKGQVAGAQGFYGGLRQDRDQMSESRQRLVDYLEKKREAKRLEDKSDKMRDEDKKIAGDRWKKEFGLKEKDLENQEKRLAQAGGVKPPSESPQEYTDAAGKTRLGRYITGRGLVTTDNDPMAPQKKAEGELGATEKGRFDNIAMATRSLQGMGMALEGGQKTFKLVGDNDFTQNAALFKEAIGRMQSGGAIGKEEARDFINMLPTVFDSAEMRQKKLARLSLEMESRLKTLGKKPEDITPLPPELMAKKPTPSGTATASPAATAPLKDPESMSIEELEAELGGQ